MADEDGENDADVLGERRMLCPEVMDKAREVVVVVGWVAKVAVQAETVSAPTVAIAYPTNGDNRALIKNAQNAGHP